MHAEPFDTEMISLVVKIKASESIPLIEKFTVFSIKLFKSPLILALCCYKKLKNFSCKFLLY